MQFFLYGYNKQFAETCRLKWRRNKAAHRAQIAKIMAETNQTYTNAVMQKLHR